jgi:hypothetical protein
LIERDNARREQHDEDGKMPTKCLVDGAAASAATADALRRIADVRAIRSTSITVLLPRAIDQCRQPRQVFIERS